MKRLFLPITLLLSCASIHSMDYAKQEQKHSLADLLYVPNEDGDTVLHTLIKNNDISKKVKNDTKKLTAILECQTLNIMADSDSESEELNELKKQALAEYKKLEEEHAATERNLSATLSNLITCGVDVNAQNKHGETAFHIALKQNPNIALTLLTKHRKVINPNIRDENIGFFPLEYATYRLKNPTLVSELLYCGADVKILLQPRKKDETVASQFYSLSLPMKAVITAHIAQMPKKKHGELLASLVEKSNTIKKEMVTENKNDGTTAEEEEGPFVAEVVKLKTLEQTLEKKRNRLYGQPIDNDYGKPTDSADSDED